MANDFLRLTDLSGSDTAGYVLCLHLGTAITGNTHSHAVHLHPLLHTAAITGVVVGGEGGGGGGTAKQNLPDIISFLRCT